MKQLGHIKQRVKFVRFHVAISIWKKSLGLFRPGNGREAVGKLLVNDRKFTNIEEVNCHVYVWVNVDD